MRDWKTELRPRFDLAPRRFEHYHPKMGHWFASHALPPILPDPPRECVPVIGRPPGHCPPPGTIPEPSSVALLPIGLAMAFLLRRRLK